MSSWALELPRFTNWLLPDDALDTVRTLIAQHEPQLLLEVGSGRSTVVLAHAMRGRGRFVSLEDQPEYAAEVRSYLERNQLPGEVRCSALVPYEPGLVWYGADAWEDLYGIDMLLVDGPVGATAPQARYPALPLLAGRLLPGALVILDDTYRQDEKQVLRRWGLRGATQVLHSGGALSWGYLP